MKLRELFDRAVLPETATAESSAPPPTCRRSIPDPATIIAASLGQKVLHGWLQNRHQTRYPLILNLRLHSPAEVALILESVGHALRAGDADEPAVADALAWLHSIGADPALTGLPGPNPDAAPLLDRVRVSGLTAQAYAASTRALGRRTLTNRRYLDYLSARLGIPDEVARSIHRRFGG